MATNRYILTAEQSRRIERLLRSESSSRGRMRRRQPTSTAAYIQAGFEPRLAYCSASSSDRSDSNRMPATIDAVDGDPISGGVYCIIAGGGPLSTAFPMLTEGLPLPIMYNPTTGEAYATTVFQKWIECVCTSP